MWSSWGLLGDRRSPRPRQRSGPAIGESTAFVRAYGPDGEFRWARRFGGPGIDGVSSVAAGPATEVVVAGTTQSALADHDPAGGRDAFVRMYR